MSTAPTQMAIDGKWVPCLPTDEFGTLGVRYTCDLRDDDGRPAKRLLLRRRVFPALGGSSAQLVVSRAVEGSKFGLRLVAGKSYQEAHGGGEEHCKVLQQDVSGLTPLGRAVLQALKEGDSARVWRLFYSGCEALRLFGNSVESGKLVPLQCPPSLAVTPNGSVVLLDAEIRVAGSLPDDSPVRRLFQAWFGPPGVSGFGDARQASLLHSRALLAYFLNLLRQAAPTAPTPAARSATVKVATKLEQAPAGADLDDLENWVRNNTEDWSLPVDEEVPSAGEDEAPRRDQRVRTQRPPEALPIPAVNVQPIGLPSAPPRKKRPWLLPTSLLLNLLLLVALVILWLLWPKGASAKPAAGDTPFDFPNGDAPLTFSSYCVVFPTQGTISEKVAASLGDLFPGKATEIKRDPEEHRRMLAQKLGDAVKSLDQPDKLKQLLVEMATNHGIRFKGFVAAEPNETLPSLIERGGVFTSGGAQGEQYGSLLQLNSVERLLGAAGISGQREAAARLNNLRTAVEDYASLQDALGIINDRTAYLLRVEPTPEAHGVMRNKLLSRQDKPVFISRPVPELFDAVDPTADTGGGSAAYTLMLDRKCVWRLAGADDRKNVDYSSNASNDRMKWQAFDSGRLISWKPIPLTLKGGKTKNVATFDIAVPLENKVVLFRNQSILVGDTRAQVIKQGRNYIEQVLEVKGLEPEDTISVQQQDQQFTGTLIYSLLADQVTADVGEDLQVMGLEEFKQMKTKEDDF